MEQHLSTDYSRQVISLATEVQRRLGPGLPESVYEESLCEKLRRTGIPFVRQPKLPYRECSPNASYQVDIVVDGSLMVELKSLQHTASASETTLLSFIRLDGHPRRLLLTFNAVAASPRRAGA